MDRIVIWKVRGTLKDVFRVALSGQNEIYLNTEFWGGEGGRQSHWKFLNVFKEPTEHD